MSNCPGNCNSQPLKKMECNFTLSGITVQISVPQDQSSYETEKALVEKAIEQVRWQLIKSVYPNQIF